MSDDTNVLVEEGHAAGVMLHCKRCNHRWLSRCADPKRCPNCCSYLWNEFPRMHICLRCGHTWRSRNGREPVICPKCKTSKWNMSNEIYQEKYGDGGDRTRNIIQMYDRGCSYVEICRENECSAEVVFKAIRTYRKKE